ncbi:MAG: TMEM43 family protein [Lysobacter sp.]
MPDAVAAGPCLKRAWVVVLMLPVLLLGATGVFAQPVREGVPQPGKSPRDTEFGVGTRQFGLEREVEMYQWRASDDGYQTVWNSARIDSSQFAPGHENPPVVPLDSRRWWAEGSTLDGHPIDPKVLHGLGSWQRFRPDFSRLPANLAASFQPEGDGLGSSENPLAPQVGDVRVHWRELLLPSLVGKLELRDGVWRLTPEAAVAPASLQPAIEIPDVAEIRLREWLPWLAAAVAVLAGLWLLLRRRRRVSRQEA